MIIPHPNNSKEIVSLMGTWGAKLSVDILVGTLCGSTPAVMRALDLHHSFHHWLKRSHEFQIITCKIKLLHVQTETNKLIVSNIFIVCKTCLREWSIITTGGEMSWDDKTAHALKATLFCVPLVKHIVCSALCLSLQVHQTNYFR